MTTQQCKALLSANLSHLYDQREAGNIVSLLMEEWLGKEALRQDRELTSAEYQRFMEAESRLLHAEPVQYILGYTWFYNHTFLVNPDVLIPRPETEELVQWVLDEFRDHTGHMADMGTGSGAIAITLAHQLTNAQVIGMDISPEAIKIAEKNAAQIGVEIQWLSADIFSDEAWSMISHVQVLVCNPPYIPLSEKDGMHPNVSTWEPATALFVSDEDPLIYYRHIMQKAMTWLPAGCYLFFEIHEQFGPDMMHLADSIGWTDIQLRSDLQGRNRMMRMRKP